MGNTANGWVVSKGCQRWLTLVATICIQCCLGSVYTWSLFNVGFAQKFGHTVNEVAFSFALFCLFLSLSSPVAGRIQDYIGTRLSAAFSGVLLGGSYALASMAPTLVFLYLIAGVMVGCAEGMGYLPTLSNCVRWFPEKKGVISALVVGAYGLGSLSFKYINFYMLSHFGLEKTFILLGGVVAVCITTFALGLFDAPKQTLTPVIAGDTQRGVDFPLFQSMRFIQFWMLAIIFLITSAGGVYVLGTVKDLGQSLAGLSVRASADSVAVIAAANIAGRLVMGSLSDRMTRIKVITIGQFLSLLGLALLIFTHLNQSIFYLAVACILFNFGGTLSVFPGLIGEYFGLNNLNKNYGFIYLGFGVGGLVGLVLSSLLSSFTISLVVTLCLTMMAICISLFVNNPSFGVGVIAPKEEKRT